MNSYTKTNVSRFDAKKLFDASGVGVAESIKEIEAGEYSSFKTLPGPLPIAEIEALEESPDWKKIPLPSEDLLF